ncbi:MAG TPA: PspC domain-containing protein [Thermoclostridium sp.]|nr:PspC domain-containing protein [Thermoclostridium sp.]
MRRKLFRNTSDRIFGGVCSGLAQFAQVETGLLRFLAVVAILATGLLPGIIVYILFVLIIPSDKDFKSKAYDGMDENPESNESNPENTRLFIGISLIIIGMLSLAKLLFDFSWRELRYFIPVALVVFGAVLIYRSRGISE